MNGTIPSENHFECLIESTINKIDDGFYKDEEGLHLSPSPEDNRLMTLYNNADESTPFFTIGYNGQDEASMQFKPCLKSVPGSPADEKQAEENSFFFHHGGRLGIGTKSSDVYGMQVRGYAAMEGRIGTYQSGTVDADGKWKKLPGLMKLNNCNAFEIIARVGKKGTGKFAILHAIAICAYGPSGGKIKKTSTCFGFYWNKLSLRWRGDKHNYRLEICTRSNYGKGSDGKNIPIYYHITKLWEDRHFLPEDTIHQENFS
ncbi:MAG: hypothetical protein ABUM51_05775 [Bacteroidota bacterium]